MCQLELCRDVAEKIKKGQNIEDRPYAKGQDV